MKVGRPLLYQTLDDMLPVLAEWEQSISEGEVPTVTGLTLALGFADKSTLYDYTKKPEFSHSLKRALTIVEHGYELALRSKEVGGAIFALKNMGWIDKVQQSIDIPQLKPVVISVEGE